MQITVLFRSLMSQRDFATDRCTTYRVQIELFAVHALLISWLSVKKTESHAITLYLTYKLHHGPLPLNSSLNLNAGRICSNDALKHSIEQVGQDCQTSENLGIAKI